MPVQRVAVIGAGSSGLPAIKMCLEEGLEPVCFERTDDMGGLWNFREKVKDGQASVMRSTVSNTSKEMSAFSDFPPPKETPLMMHHTVVTEYFRKYADHFQLNRHIRYNTEVTSVKRTTDFADTGRWVVISTDHQTGESRTETYDAVMVCSGHHWDTNIPSFPGLSDFQGPVIHSHDFRPGDEFLDKNILVVGFGNSGGDVAVELSRYGQVYISTRSGSWIFPVRVNGYPLDMLFHCRYQALKDHLMPLKWVEAKVYALANHCLDHDCYGLTPRHSPLSQALFANDEIVSRMACGSVKVTDDVKRFTRHGAEFKDGTYQDIDVVVMATGYFINYPFMEKEVLDVKDNQVQLYSLIYPPKLEHPTLAVIGCIQPNSCIWVVAEMQCRFATRVFKGLIELPSRQSMVDEAHQRTEMQKKLFKNTPRHTIETDWLAYLDSVADMIGCKPNIGKLLLTDPVLGLKVLFQPAFPYHYRLQGPGQWSGARQAILTAMDRCWFPLKGRALPAEGKPLVYHAAEWICYPCASLVGFLGVLVVLLFLYYIFF